MGINEDDIPFLPRYVRFRRERFGGFIFNARKDELLQLNRTSFHILTLIDGQKSIKKIIDILLKEYKGNSKEIVHDALMFVEELFKREFIEFLKKERVTTYGNTD